MKYSTNDLIRIFIILATLVLLYLTLLELRVALSGSPASAQASPCTAPTPSPTFPPSATPTASPSPLPSPSASPTPTPLPNATILLTEFMACPNSANEWIELYNASSTTIQVTNWQVIDEANNKKTISGSIPANAFATFEWSGSLLNNTGDSFKVITETGQIIAEASYGTCTSGISFVYENGEWVGAIASPNEETEISENTTSTATGSALALATNPSSVIQEIRNTTPTTQNSPTATPLPHKQPALNTQTKSTPPLTQKITSQQSKSNTAPAISVILGGLLQLLSGSYAFYETYFKQHG